MRKATIGLVMSVCSSIRPFVRMGQLGSQWMDLNEICYLSTFRKYVEKIQVSLKSDKYNGYFTWRTMYIDDNISPSSSYNEKYFKQNL